MIEFMKQEDIDEIIQMAIDEERYNQYGERSDSEDDPHSSHSSPEPDAPWEPPRWVLCLRSAYNYYQNRILDRIVLKKPQRWLFTFTILSIFIYRVITTPGFYAIAYLLGFHI